MTTVDGGGVTIDVSVVPSVSVTVTTGGGAGRVVDGRLGVVTLLVLLVGLALAVLILTPYPVFPNHVVPRRFHFPADGGEGRRSRYAKRTKAIGRGCG
ncbi:hypothetical protein [uncultured Mycobacterium sp.]|uniref:hypothetical protein n=1 Tax=uncultured Mycobacterium sp. TaxID=171292 RepID=UPI0035CA9BED